MIRLARPALDLVLGAGDRVSRVVEPEDLDWSPPRAVSKATAQPRLKR